MLPSIREAVMSNVGQSITIRISNAVPDRTLGFVATGATSGPLPTASAAAVGPNGTITVSARSDGGGCTGSFALVGSDVRFDVSYAHPGGVRATEVMVRASTGHVWSADDAV
jgi:hypothetical protein